MRFTEGGQPDLLSFAGLRSGGKGGGSSSSGTSYSTGTTTSLIPDWVRDASMGALQNAQAIAATPYESLQTAAGGQLVADVSPDTLQAYQQIRNLQGSTDPAYNAAIGQWGSLLGNLQSLTPDQQNALTNSLYGNYGQQVINPAQSYLSGAYGNAQNLYGQALGLTQGAYGQALGGSAGLLGNYLANAAPATAQQVAGNVSTLMNPYINMVAGPTQQIYNQMIDQQLQGNAGQAANVGAFGGSRMGVQNAVAQAQGSLGAEQYMGNLLSQGYNAALQPAYNLASQASQQGYNAASLLSGEGMQAAQAIANQGYGSAQGLGSFGSNAANALVGLLQGGYGTSAGQAQNIMSTNLGLGQTAASQIPSLAHAQYTDAATQAAALQSIGTAQQQQQQAQINANLADYMWQTYYPQQQQNELLSTLGSIPYSTMTTGTSYGTQNSSTQYNPSISSSIGGAMSLLGSTGTATAAGSGILGLLSMV
jgi:hypothetical protein